MKHTPGPWEVSKSGSFVRLPAPDNRAICRMNHGSVWEWAQPKGSIEDRANARLIAAAPELLEACRMLTEHDDCECDNTHKQNNTVCRYCYARQAITKATGEEG